MTGKSFIVAEEQPAPAGIAKARNIDIVKPVRLSSHSYPVSKRRDESELIVTFPPPPRQLFKLNLSQTKSLGQPKLDNVGLNSQTCSYRYDF